MELNGQWALVTGASGGLGTEFAALLAERGVNLVLAARSAERLDVLAADLRSRYDVEVLTEQSDLSAEGAAEALVGQIRRRGISLDILINNAGQGRHGQFIDQSAEVIDTMIRLNISSLTSLTHYVAAEMAKHAGGHILLVSSLTSFMPAPTYAVYAATKAYVRNFGEALHAELKPHNVVVTVLSPGLIDTGFLHAAGQQPSKSMRNSMASPRVTAKAGLDALFAGRQNVVAGGINKAIAIASRVIPRAAQTKMMANALNR